MNEPSTGILQEVDEALRADKLERFWRRHSLHVLLGVALLLALAAGYGLWRSEMRRRDMAATSQLLQAARLSDAGDKTGAMTALEPLETSGTPLATLALLRHAALLAQNGDTAKASALYARAAELAPAKSALGDLARLQKAILAANEAAPFKLDFAGADASGRPFSGVAREIKAASALQAEDKKQASALLNTPEALMESAPSSYRHIDALRSLAAEGALP